MELRKIEQTAPDVLKMAALNEEAFPENERVSIYDLYRFGADGSMDMLGIYNDADEFAGFFVIRKFRHFAYIAYFAVCAEKRSQGIGSTALRLLKAYYPGRQIMVDFESAVPESPNYAERIRRRRFYYRNGFFETGWYQFYMETEFEIACSVPEFDKSGFDALIADIHAHAPDFHPTLYRKDGQASCGSSF